MNKSESYVFEILKNNSNNGEWKFFEVKDMNGNSKPQAKNYGGGYVSYPDFELYSDKKLLLLVEVKGQNGYFEQTDGMVAMKHRCFKNYKEVRAREDIDVRICFVIEFENGDIEIFWDTIDNVCNYNYYLQKRSYPEYDYSSKKMITKTDEFIYWKAEDFRNDKENVGRI